MWISGGGAVSGQTTINTTRAKCCFSKCSSKHRDPFWTYELPLSWSSPCSTPHPPLPLTFIFFMKQAKKTPLQRNLGWFPLKLQLWREHTLHVPFFFLCTLTNWKQLQVLMFSQAAVTSITWPFSSDISLRKLHTRADTLFIRLGFRAHVIRQRGFHVTSQSHGLTLSLHLSHGWQKGKFHLPYSGGTAQRGTEIWQTTPTYGWV